MKNGYSKVSKDDDEEEGDITGDLELATIATDVSSSLSLVSSSDDYDDDKEHQQQCVASLSKKKGDGPLKRIIDNDDNDKEQQQQQHHQRLLEIWRLENMAVPLCYFMIGLVQGILYPVINVYPLDIHATEAQQQTLWFLKSLPSCLKILFGILSDNVPIFGYRRKIYMIIGYTISSISLMALYFFSNLTLTRLVVDDNDDESPTTTTTTTTIPPDDAPSIPLLSIVIFVWATGIWMSDVMGDSLVAERAKYESDENRGNLQTICYGLRALGIGVMYPISSHIYSKYNRGPSILIGTCAMIPFTLFPFCYFLKETKNPSIHPPMQQLQQLYHTACNRAVWQPMGFIYIYLVLYVSNAAWKEFLKSVLGFTSSQINTLLLVGGLGAVLGVLLYKFILQAYHFSWRTIFILGIVFNGIFSFLQICLIHQKIPFGISPFFFSMGDDTVRDFLSGTQYIPMCVMMVNLVQEGIEGSSYALFTTTWNASLSLADALSTTVLSIWDVSKETMIQNNESSNGMVGLYGLQNLTILTTILPILPIFFIRMMPHSVEDLQRLKEQENSFSKLGGSIYLSIVSLSVTAAIFIGIMNVIKPGWMGES